MLQQLNPSPIEQKQFEREKEKQATMRGFVFMPSLPTLYHCKPEKSALFFSISQHCPIGMNEQRLVRDLLYECERASSSLSVAKLNVMCPTRSTYHITSPYQRLISTVYHWSEMPLSAVSRIRVASRITNVCVWVRIATASTACQHPLPSPNHRERVAVPFGTGWLQLFFLTGRRKGVGGGAKLGL